MRKIQFCVIIAAMAVFCGLGVSTTQVQASLIHIVKNKAKDAAQGDGGMASKLPGVGGLTGKLNGGVGGLTGKLNGGVSGLKDKFNGGVSGLKDKFSGKISETFCHKLCDKLPILTGACMKICKKIAASH